MSNILQVEEEPVETGRVVALASRENEVGAPSQRLVWKKCVGREIEALSQNSAVKGIFKKYEVVGVVQMAKSVGQIPSLAVAMRRRSTKAGASQVVKVDMAEYDVAPKHFDDLIHRIIVPPRPLPTNVVDLVNKLTCEDDGPHDSPLLSTLHDWPSSNFFINVSAKMQASPMHSFNPSNQGNYGHVHTPPFPFQPHQGVYVSSAIVIELCQSFMGTKCMNELDKLDWRQQQPTENQNYTAKLGRMKQRQDFHGRQRSNRISITAPPL
ncbi:uncharacterized protein HKW66_Vig0201290 [Vigna angularis]|uniref:Uncharacterized protein n=1 Tax=Phaseolus angularis TaxID=3914 RepID=A0A8T0JU96_PHAAN|nr:uncharacterized protein HKW66_Vig0201290 [Vigna angularis]